MRTLLILASLFLISCNEPKNTTNSYKLPPELKDCKVFVIHGNQTLYVVKCEGKSTTSSKYSYKSGKHMRQVNVSLIED